MLATWGVSVIASIWNDVDSFIPYNIHVWKMNLALLLILSVIFSASAFPEANNEH